MSRLARMLAAAIVLSAAIAHAHAQTARRREPPPPADAASVDSIVAALYAAVTHPAGGSPDFERLRAIFHRVGMFIPPKAPNAPDFLILDVDGYAGRWEKAVADRKAKGEPPVGFFEREVSRRTDCFGNVCQVFSTYEARRSASDEKPFVRGINSIQLVRDGSRWWIASVVWDTERADNPIPAQYLAPK